MRLKRFNNFNIDEKQGIPPTFSFAGVVAKELVDMAFKSYNEMNLRFMDKAELDSKYYDQLPLPVKSINLILTSTIDPWMDNTESTASFSNFEEDENGKITFVLRSNIILNKEFANALFGVDDKIKEKFRAFLLKKITSTMAHELTHAYEEYMRVHNKKQVVKMEDTKEFLYDKAAIITRSEFTLPEPLLNFLFLIYASASYEINARVPEAYSLVSQIPDSHDRLEIIKGTPSWEIAMGLINFDAQKVYDALIADGKKHNVGEEEIREGITKLFSTMTMGMELSQMNLKQGIMQKIAEFNSNRKEDKKKLDDELNLISSYSEEISNSKKKVSDPLKFMKGWEKKFHQAGARLKNKLSKLTTL